MALAGRRVPFVGLARRSRRARSGRCRSPTGRSTPGSTPGSSARRMNSSGVSNTSTGGFHAEGTRGPSARGGRPEPVGSSILRGVGSIRPGRVQRGGEFASPRAWSGHGRDPRESRRMIAAERWRIESRWPAGPTSARDGGIRHSGRLVPAGSVGGSSRLDLDPPRLGALGLGQDEPEDAVLELGGDPARGPPRRSG